ncbi:membrane protein DedA, SNARE-associated domain [Thermomonospora echinospora]|uniref:Membrane protein DedA, SNARE-associated domain n=1 Tax=Thermomonospora echinospora TaxID=1992 RepID=A0A1H6DHT5_9ACTN|nr:VTT domain-containing protein [Thermomonospora echinospora]SEG84780.1 membrane protein DedA, SNARE-associated domain [Thermomonospora echinospora]
MIDQVLEGLRGAVTSPWFYAALLAFACVDAFFPAVPSESLVIMAGVYAASGEPNLVGVVACAAAGAFVGDHVAFWMGRSSRGRVSRWRRRTRRGRALERAERTLRRRGGLVLVVARYVPGGRTAVTVTMGAVGYPARLFVVFAAVAAVSWAWYAALAGYVGGRAFEEDPVRGLLVGFGLAVGITAGVESARFAWSRRAGRAGRGARRGATPLPAGTARDGADAAGGVGCAGTLRSRPASTRSIRSCPRFGDLRPRS